MGNALRYFVIACPTKPNMVRLMEQLIQLGKSEGAHTVEIAPDIYHGSRLETEVAAKLTKEFPP